MLTSQQVDLLRDQIDRNASSMTMRLYQHNKDTYYRATGILNLPEVKEQLSVYITDKETERQYVYQLPYSHLITATTF